MRSHEEERLAQRVDDGSATVTDYIALGELLAVSGRGDEALAVYRRGLDVAEQRVTQAELLCRLGWLHYRRGESTEALGCAQDGLRLLDQMAPGMAITLLRGLHLSLQAHCLWPTDTSAAALCARRALDHLAPLIETTDLETATAAGRETAVLHNLLGEPRTAAAISERLLYLPLPGEGRLQLLVVLAEARRRTAQLHEAEAAVEEAFRWIEADRNALPRLCFELGLIQKAAGRPDEALRSFSRALGGLEASPVFAKDQHFYAEIHWNLGELYYELGRYGRAIGAFKAVSASGAGCGAYRPNAMLWIAHSHLALGEIVEAERCYHAVLESPTAPEETKALAAKVLRTLQSRRPR